MTYNANYKYIINKKFTLNQRLNFLYRKIALLPGIHVRKQLSSPLA